MPTNKRSPAARGYVVAALQEPRGAETGAGGAASTPTTLSSGHMEMGGPGIWQGRLLQLDFFDVTTIDVGADQTSPAPCRNRQKEGCDRDHHR